MSEIIICTLEDLEKKLKLKPRTIREKIRDRELIATKVGKRWLVPEEQLRDFLR